MFLCSKQSSLFSFYALTSGGKLKDVVVHCHYEGKSLLNMCVDPGSILSITDCVVYFVRVLLIYGTWVCHGNII